MEDPIDVRDHSGEEGVEGFLDIVYGAFQLFILLPLSILYSWWESRRRV